MTPHAANQGKSFKGVAAYIIHDPDRAKTSERVLFTQTLNLRIDDPQKAAKSMAAIITNTTTAETYARMIQKRRRRSWPTLLRTPLF